MKVQEENSKFLLANKEKKTVVTCGNCKGVIQNPDFPCKRCHPNFHSMSMGNIPRDRNGNLFPTLEGTDYTRRSINN